jgi:predicted RNase H-like HicB family nuclease
LEARVPRYHFSAIVCHDTDGYWARCPELPGCYVQGDTHEEALQNLREACTLYVEDRLACGEEVPRLETVSIIGIDVNGSDEVQKPDTGREG